MFRSAVTYVVAVIAVAGVAFAAAVVWLADRRDPGAGRFVRRWCQGAGSGLGVEGRGVWPDLAGAGWFLLLLMLVCLDSICEPVGGAADYQRWPLTATAG